MKKTISLPAGLYDRAKKQGREAGYPTFSDIVQSALRDALSDHATRTIS